MVYKKYCISIYWASVNTGLVWWNSLGIESPLNQRIISLGEFIFPLLSETITFIFAFFIFFYRAFFTSEKYLQKTL
jgi:hypothetical protein